MAIVFGNGDPEPFVVVDRILYPVRNVGPAACDQVAVAGAEQGNLINALPLWYLDWLAPGLPFIGTEADVGLGVLACTCLPVACLRNQGDFASLRVSVD